MNNHNHAGDEEGGEEDSKALGRILSIQSHVVHGYVIYLTFTFVRGVTYSLHPCFSPLTISIVGNKSAVFPLQLLGLDVDPINR